MNKEKLKKEIEKLLEENRQFAPSGSSEVKFGRIVNCSAVAARIMGLIEKDDGGVNTEPYGTRVMCESESCLNNKGNGVCQLSHINLMDFDGIKAFKGLPEGIQPQAGGCFNWTDKVKGR